MSWGILSLVLDLARSLGLLKVRVDGQHISAIYVGLDQN